MLLGRALHDRAIVGQPQVTQLVAVREHLQTTVFRGRRVDRQTGVDIRGHQIAKRVLAFAKPQVLVKAVTGSLGGSGRLPVNLLRHLLDVGPKQRLHHGQHARVAPQALEQRADPGDPVRLQHIPLARIGLGKNFVQQILVPVSGVVLLGQLVDALGLDLNFGHLGLGKHAPHHGVSVLPVMIDMVQIAVGMDGLGHGHGLAHRCFRHGRLLVGARIGGVRPRYESAPRGRQRFNSRNCMHSASVLTRLKKGPVPPLY